MSVCEMDTSMIKKQTNERLTNFNKLRGTSDDPGRFWDVVVITAVDETQKESYELQVKMKLERKELPLSARYIVVADPPGPKIGNGGSTLVVIDHLFKLFGDEVWLKRVIVIHAGGFSQRLPNASVMGKAFLGIPIGEPMYQALDLKLATYFDFPQKISSGGIFVCCADSIEVYNDNNTPWMFASDGFTALAHMSPVSIGTTHGVFVLEQPVAEHDIVWNCRRFLHKPSIELMDKIKNCVVLRDGKENWVMTDSAFFISTETAKLLLSFYEKHAPLTCEVDAYGDFLQALCKDSSPDYTKNCRNVFKETNSLIETRQQIYNLLNNTPLYAVVLAPTSDSFSCPKRGASASSIFYHIGTMPEYQHNFTKDKNFRSIMDLGSLTFCKGVPHHFYNTDEGNSEITTLKVSDQGALSCSIQHVQYNAPCIMGSVIRANVSIGEGTIIEYSFIREGVTIGDNCIISNCSAPRFASVPNNVFMHTAAIRDKSDTLYVTVIFRVDVDTKKNVPAQDALAQLTYFGKPLGTYFTGKLKESSKKVSKWNAKLFPASKTMEESCEKACKALGRMETDSCCNLYDDNEALFSMEDVLQLKEIQSIVEFRKQLSHEIHSSGCIN